MTGKTEKDLIYDWNLHQGLNFAPARPVEFNDETLRDGLQCPSVKDPAISEKISILHFQNRLGIHASAIGLPAAGPMAYQSVLELAKEVVANKLSIQVNCAARTLESDIVPIAEISQKAGVKIEACTFIGSSPIRQYIEGWDLDFLLKKTEKAVSFAIGEGLPVMFVTEDTVRSKPEDLERLYRCAIDSGATRICLCDTIGHITPEGTQNLVRFIRKSAGDAIKVDWHGHRDRGLGEANSLAAIVAGVDRVHGTVLGIGERSGNTAIDLMLANCKLLGWIDNDLSSLHEYCQKVASSVGIPIPSNYPIFGTDAFRTSTGVHASALIKAEAKGEKWLADSVYSGVPASWFGREQVVEIGPMSGESNVVYWLKKRGLKPKKESVDAILRKAKSSDRVLSEREVIATLDTT